MGVAVGVAWFGISEDVEEREVEDACVNLLLYWSRYVDFKMETLLPPGPTRDPIGPSEVAPMFTVLPLLMVDIV